MKALKFAYRDRRQKNAIYVVFGLPNAGTPIYNLNYSHIYKFKQLNIHINRNGLPN
jgi:ribosomal protein L20